MAGGRFSGFEVHGHTITRLINEGSPWVPLVERVLIDAGIAERHGDGPLHVPADAWYPLDLLLGLLQAIKREAGDAALVTVGGAVPRSAPFPPALHDVPSALRAVNTAYHRNHKKDGKLMLDTSTGTPLAGLGDYLYAEDGPRSATMRCDTPYPCQFDLGLVTAMAQRFDVAARTLHDPGPCRASGDSHCVYRIRW